MVEEFKVHFYVLASNLKPAGHYLDLDFAVCREEWKVSVSVLSDDFCSNLLIIILDITIFGP